MDAMEDLAYPVREDFLDHQANRVQLVSQVLKENQVERVLRACPVSQENKVHQV